MLVVLLGLLVDRVIISLRLEALQFAGLLFLSVENTVNKYIIHSFDPAQPASNFA